MAQQKTVAIGGVTFTIEAVQTSDGWQAVARGTSGERYGPVVSDRDAGPAIARLERWLTWQRDHDEKLRLLQEAEQIYHRTIAGSAFAAPTEGPSATELQTDALRRLERARLALDAVRRDKPE
jgi:hypothetical protein